MLKFKWMDNFQPAKVNFSYCCDVINKINENFIFEAHMLHTTQKSFAWVIACKEYLKTLTAKLLTSREVKYVVQNNWDGNNACKSITHLSTYFDTNSIQFYGHVKLNITIRHLTSKYISIVSWYTSLHDRLCNINQCLWSIEKWLSWLITLIVNVYVNRK